jgi:hypothetical protein
MLTCGQHGEFTAKRTKVSECCPNMCVELVKDNRFLFFVASCVGLFKDIGCQWESLDKTLVCCSNHQPDFPVISSFVRVMCNLLEVFRTM